MRWRNRRLALMRGSVKPNRTIRSGKLAGLQIGGDSAEFPFYPE